MSLAFSRLPAPLRHLLQARLSSTFPGSDSRPTHNSFPFPKHANPSPHEIFHLTRGASQKDVKSRYYELVRIHHPDCPAARGVSPATSHSRFQAISEAYRILSGGRPSSSYSRDAPYEEELRRRTRAHWRASAGSDEFGTSGASALNNHNQERWDQGVLVFIVVFVLASTILPLSMLSPFARSNSDRRHDEARKNLAIARREAREFAEMRRLALVQRKEGGSLALSDIHPQRSVTPVSEISKGNGHR